MRIGDHIRLASAFSVWGQ